MMAPRLISAIFCVAALVGARPHAKQWPTPEERSGWRILEEDSSESRPHQSHRAKERHWSHPQHPKERWVEYDLSELPGYAKRKGLFLRLDSTGFVGAPRMELASRGMERPRFRGAFQVGEVLEIDAQVRSGDTVTMPIPLPDGMEGVRVQDLQVVHRVDGSWREEAVVEVRDGAAWTRMTSFSPVAVGLVQTPRALAAGGWHLLWVRQGRIWSAGANDFGQLGNQESGGSKLEFVPIFWPRSVPVVAVAAGLRHSLALDSVGNVWAWGDNRVGQCGWTVTGSTALTTLVRPVLVIDATADTSRRIVQIAAGDSASYAVTASGRLLSWGANGRRQLGRGGAGVDSAYEVIPKFVAKAVNGAGIPLEGVLQVAAGEKHALALLQSGLIQGWGANDAYQLGSTAPAGNNRDPVEVKIMREIYGADTLIASGCSGPDSTGCWSQKIIRPWYDPPSQIGAGGNSSYAKLLKPSSQGLTAVNLLWGANDSGRILAGTSASQPNPVVVSNRGQNMLELGRSHLLEAYNAGATYFPAPIGAALTLYPVFGQGANPSRQTDPVAASNKVAVWKEIVRPGQVSRMMAGSLAAGADFSAVSDSRLDSVYVWGGSWGALQKPARTDGTFLEIVSHKDGDTIPRNLDSVQVVWRVWTGATAGSLTTTLVVPTTDAQGRILLTVVSGANKVAVVVVRGLAGPVAKPASLSFDRRQNQKPSFQIQVPYDARKMVVLLWDLRAPSTMVAKADLGAQTKGSRIVAPSAWADANGSAMELRDGSYGISVAFQFVGQKTAWDTLKITQVGASESWVNAKKLRMGIPDGGPDSFQVSLPGRGVLAGYLRRTVGELPGVRVVGSWDLRDSGLAQVAGWNLSDSLRAPIHDSLAVSYFGWYFRSVSDGFRLVGGSCVDWVGMNTTRMDPFLSEVAVERLNLASNCALEVWVRDRANSAVTQPSRNLTVGPSQDVDLGWMWPGKPTNAQRGMRAVEWKTTPANPKEAPDTRTLQVK